MDGLVRIFGIGFIITLVVAGCYVAYTYFAAYLSVKATPKEEMNWCPRHGPVRKQDMITFLDVPYCPRCFHERMQDAEQVANQLIRDKGSFK